VGVRELTRETLSLWWGNLGRLVVLAAPIFLVGELAVALVDPSANGPFADVSLYVAFSAAMYLAVYPMAQAAMVARLAGLGSSIGNALDRGADRLHALAVATLLYGVGVGIGLLLLVVPGAIAYARWGLYLPVLVVERPSATRSLGRSAELVRGRTGTVLVVLLVTGAIGAVIGIPALLAYAVEHPVAVWLGGAAFDTVVASVTATAVFVLYQRLREQA
jgi:hypothetical protein